MISLPPTIGTVVGQGKTIKCLGCNTEITSMHRHDFVQCECGNIAIDGGSDYTRVMWRSYANYEDFGGKVMVSRYQPSDFTVGEISWRPGDEFNYRIYKALLLVDNPAAKRYYYTTVSGA